MAKGDLALYKEFANQMGGAIHNFEAAGNTFKVALYTASVSASTVPNTSWATPAYASTNEVTGTGYSAGGDTLASQSYNLSSATATFDALDNTWSQNSSGFTNARYGFLYNFTDASSRGIAWISMGSPAASQVAGDVTISWNTSGIFTCAVS
jgi:hypothetical protein